MKSFFKKILTGVIFLILVISLILVWLNYRFNNVNIVVYNDTNKEVILEIHGLGNIRNYKTIKTVKVIPGYEHSIYYPRKLIPKGSFEVCEKGTRMCNFKEIRCRGFGGCITFKELTKKVKVSSLKKHDNQ